VKPRAEQDSIFSEIGEIRMVGVANLVVLACVLWVTTKQKVVNFFGGKSAPPETILATPVTHYKQIHAIEQYTVQ